jgi:hypothetical protein
MCYQAGMFFQILVENFGLFSENYFRLTEINVPLLNVG